MNKLLCALLIALPLISKATPETSLEGELYLKYTKQVAEMDSFINREVEALAVKSAYSSQHPDILTHQKNIQKAVEVKKTLALHFGNGNIMLCKKVFN